jgi:hypothetical protein
MSVSIPYHLQQQLALVLSELRETVGLETTKTYLGLLRDAVESSSCPEGLPTQCMPIGTVGTVEDSRTASPIQGCVIDTPNIHLDHTVPRKRKRDDPSGVGTVGLLRSDLVDFLTTHWNTLKADGLYTDSMVPEPREGVPSHALRLHHHLVLRGLQIEDELSQWRRSIAEIRNLESYQIFLAEASHRLRRN